jgi:tetratricopeptide (TPR) repeat protein
VRFKKILKKTFVIFGFIIIFLIIVWFVIRDFRHAWSRFFIEKALLENDQKQKISLLLKSIFLTPFSSTPYFELGKICFQNQNYKCAESYSKKALFLNKKEPNIYLLLINSQIEEGKIDLAEKAIEKIEQSDPLNSEFKFLKTKIEIAKGDYKKALEIINPIKEKEERYELYYILLMINENKIDKIEEPKFSKSKSFWEAFEESENPLFKKALAAKIWLDLGEEKIGCDMAKKVKEENSSIWEKIKTWQEIFKNCNL